jgi:hypothetical protein
VPFKASGNVKHGQKFEMNEKVEIKAQKMIVHELTIHPLRLEVSISFDPANSKRSFILKTCGLKAKIEKCGVRRGMAGAAMENLEKKWCIICRAL